MTGPAPGEGVHPAGRNRSAKPDGSPGAPDYIQFYPTLNCNLACGFCFNRGLEPVPDADTGEFARMLERLQAAGVQGLDLLGGEPTLHPWLEDLVAAVAARGLRSTLSSNGSGDLALLEHLEDRFGRAALRVGVSVNDREVSRELRDFIARRQPLVKSVCTRGWRLPPIAVEHLARAGSEYFLIFRDPVFPGDVHGSPSYPEYLACLGELRQRHPGAAGVVCGGFVPEGPNASRLRSVRCPAGTTKLSVLPDGSVYPCYLFFSRPEFRLGSLVTDSFDTIWNHRRLEFFRTYAGNTCPRGECPHHAVCHGGCPAVSLLVSGDLLAPDPRCVPVQPGSLGRP